MIFLLKIILSGFFLLVFAILINGIANYIGILTWYDFLSKRKNKSFLSKIRTVDYIWLFIGYPFLLGLLIYFAKTFFN